MRNNFILSLFLALGLTGMQAQDLTIKTNHTSGVVIEQRAKFDHANLRLMQVYGDACIYLGEVDFGDDAIDIADVNAIINLMLGK